MRVRSWSPARPRTRARARSSPGSAGGWRARGWRWRRSRRRTCRNNSRRDRRRRRDRPGPGDAGARLRPRAERRVQPGAAQAGQRPVGQVVVLGRARRHGQRAVVPASARRRCSTVVTATPRRPAGARSTWWSARAPARPPRSTCGRPTSSTWAWRRPPTCRSSWSATSTAAACSRTCSARSPCSTPADQARDRGVRHQQVPRRPGAARARAWTSCARSPAARRSGSCRGPTGLWLDAEDSLSAVADGVLGRPAPPHGRAVAAGGRRPAARGSRNATDAEALACEPGVAVRYVTEPSPAGRRRPGGAARLARRPSPTWPGCAAPGSPTRCVAHARGRAAGARDLRRLPDARAADRRPARGRGRRRPTGLGLLDLEVVFDADKMLANPVGDGLGRSRCAATRSTTAAWCGPGDPALLDGPARAPTRGAVLGTHWHGLLENDGFRRALLDAVADAGRPHRVPGRTGHRRSPPSGRRSSTCSATWSRSTSTPPRWSMSSVTAPRRTSRW